MRFAVNVLVQNVLVHFLFLFLFKIVLYFLPVFDTHSVIGRGMQECFRKGEFEGDFPLRREENF